MLSVYDLMIARFTRRSRSFLYQERLRKSHLSAGHAFLLLDIPKELAGAGFCGELLQVLVLIVVGVGHSPHILLLVICSLSMI